MIRLVVLIDLSEFSRTLLLLARDLSRAGKCSIVVLHQPDETLPVMAESDLIDRHKNETQERILTHLQTITENIFGSRHEVTFKVSRSHLAEQLIQLSAPSISDLILLGIRPKNAAFRWLEGSSASKVADHTEKMILAVPENEKSVSFENLCVAVNSKYPFNDEAFRSFLSLPLPVRHITFCTVAGSENELSVAQAYLQQLSTKFSDVTNITVKILQGKDPSVELDKFMTLHPGLLVLQRGPRKMTDVLRSFFINKFIYPARHPLLIVPPQKSN